MSENTKLHVIAWTYDGGIACHLAHEECHSALLECRMALGHTMTLTSWWANSSHFPDACFTFSWFLKNMFFVCDHETLSYSTTNSLKPISNLIKNWCSSYKWFHLRQISASRLAKYINHKQKSSMASKHNFSHSTIHDINRWGS